MNNGIRLSGGAAFAETDRKEVWNNVTAWQQWLFPHWDSMHSCSHERSWSLSSKSEYRGCPPVQAVIRHVRAAGGHPGYICRAVRVPGCSGVVTDLQRSFFKSITQFHDFLCHRQPSERRCLHTHNQILRARRTAGESQGENRPHEIRAVHKLHPGKDCSL